jgi:hypothetical protein
LNNKTGFENKFLTFYCFSIKNHVPIGLIIAEISNKSVKYDGDPVIFHGLSVIFAGIAGITVIFHGAL